MFDGRHLSLLSNNSTVCVFGLYDFCLLHKTYTFRDFFFVSSNTLPYLFCYRAQMKHLGFRPFTSKMKQMRADKLSNAFPRYDEDVIGDFSKTDKIFKD